MNIKELSATLPRASTAVLILSLFVGFPLAARAQNCTPGTATDWMVTADQLAAAVRPAECSVVEQSPPDFGWPAIAGPYQLTLTYPDGATKSVTTTKNWVNWAEVLPAGTYKWQVTSNGTTSRPREFTVATNATAFLVPASSTVLADLSTKPRPRGLPDTSTLATMKSQRSGAVNALLSEVKRKSRETLPGANGGDGQAYGESALRAMAAAVYSQQGNYYNEAIRRVTNLASWDPRGFSSYSSNPEGARAVAWALAVGYDWLYTRLSSSQKEQLLAALKARVGDMRGSLTGSIEVHPRDSIGSKTLVTMAVVSSLIAPDLPEATTWLNETLPLALNLISPWSGDDGGFSSGVTQGFLDLGDQLLPWYVLRWSTGIDVAKKAWVKNWTRYMTHFAPIGSPSQVFGDGLEISMKENQARFGKGYTYFAPTPLARWYAAKLTGEDQTQLEYLMAPPADTAAATFPAGTPNTVLMQSIGHVAMHSDVSNSARTSVYFKSSPKPHGAFHHSHADQNSFVVNSGGQRLAIESGYYDSYKSPHWMDWYHQTRAKNAITYDGGKGQIFYEQGGKMGHGRLTRHTTGSDYEIVTGDATPAYGGALTKAERSMVYLRPNLIVIYDSLASHIGRQWEWNIHSVNTMSALSDSKISIANGGQTLCAEMLGGPPRRFEQTDRFTTDPSGTHPRQWHGKFYSTEMLLATEFVVLLNVGCTSVTASASKTNGVWNVKVDDKAIQISDSAITVSADGNTAPTADTVAPSVPTGLTAAATSSSQINLKWNPSTDNVAVTGYLVYLNDKLLAKTTSASFSHTGLTAGSTYNYRVSAHDAVPNHSAWTASVAATTSGSTTGGTTNDTVAPSVPTGLTAAPTSSSQINLTWNASTDNVAVTGYVVYLNDTLLTKTTGTSFSHTGLTAGTTYNYRVSAYDAVPNHSAWTASVAATTSASGGTATPDTTAPTVPTGLTAAAASPSQINLTWNASTDNVAVTGYVVYLNDTLLTKTTGTSFSHTALTAGTTYNYRVSAYDAVPNHSAWTSSVAATTSTSGTIGDIVPPSVPTGLTAALASSSQINLKWNPSTDNVGVTGYYVYLNDKPLTKTATTSFSHAGLAAGSTYNYRVSAYDAVPNHSAWTPAVSQATTGDTTGGNGDNGGTGQGDTGGLPVIPGASGFGINTKAGRGGTVYKVTNLNASGSGSLLACIAASGPRVCVFEVSGTINTTSDFIIRNPYITIAGQTAPSPGVTIRGAGILTATHDVLIQHIRVRPGDASTGPAPLNRDAFKIEAVNGDSYNVVLDHVTGSWTTDELLSIWGSSGGRIYDVTIRNSIFSESLYNSTLLNVDTAYGPIVGYRASRVMLVNNLMAYNARRNPLIRDDVTDVMVINNMIYRTLNCTTCQIDFGSRGSGNVPLRASVQGNHFVLAPGLSSINTINVRADSASSFQLFVKDNTGPRMTSDPWAVVSNARDSSIKASSPPIWAQGVVPMPASAVENYVLSNAGARPLNRDSVDTRVISQVRNRTGGLINSPSQVGGYPNLAVNFRALTLPADPNAVTASGYTNLELWLHEMAKAVGGL